MPASLEVTDEVVAATGVAPGTPKFQRAKDEMILTRLDARPKKPAPEPDSAASAAHVGFRAGSRRSPRAVVRGWFSTMGTVCSVRAPLHFFSPNYS